MKQQFDLATEISSCITNILKKCRPSLQARLNSENILKIANGISDGCKKDYFLPYLDSDYLEFRIRINNIEISNGRRISAQLGSRGGLKITEPEILKKNNNKAVTNIKDKKISCDGVIESTLENKTRLMDLYSFGRQYIVNSICSLGISEEAGKLILEAHLKSPPKLDNINLVYRRMVGSAQNANMKSRVIGGAIGGVSNMASVLYDFDPQEVAKTYKDSGETDQKKLLNTISGKFDLNFEIILDNEKSLWRRFARTVIESAHWLCCFTDGGKKCFYQESDEIRKQGIDKLPNLIRDNVFGFGYPLACDFLKEVGFNDYGKPDVHIRDIFSGTELCDSDEQSLQATIREIAKSANTTAFAVDKIFWLIGTTNIAIKICEHKKKFIDDFNNKLKQ